ncbi:MULTISPECIES: hypothetical protein [Halobacteriovorax]|uniref:Flp family type IVb pilin n=1 Tax=Halobacteriovorax vibrionivorans TaxID=2152716 RepID=A0ABY0IGQ9_9BACT|nr:MULTISPECIES: hypothetical protein [Halobacteriovorax]AYF44620.1 hypothetical protein BALOs_1620 [Halobacteriovorax sp. BALOs_7]RZF20709.1 hypothetical protein DAY19_12040 [Halobacteriovorax vibrionivorans]TGD48882.1 hypothetical protein EP118_01690 [Halobacteriovorax sp. Y22]
MIESKKHNELNNDKGQTVVEYLLLITAIVSIMFAAFQTLDARFKADPGACDRGSINPLCFLDTIGLDSSTDVRADKFRYYNLR